MSNIIEKLFIESTVTAPDVTTAYWTPEETVTETVYWGYDALGHIVYSQATSSAFGSADQLSFQYVTYADDGYFTVEWIPVEGTDVTTTVVPGYYTYVTTPGQTTTEYSPNLGWNAAARSIASIMGDGSATFTPNVASIGAVIGLNELADSLGEDYREISFGLFFQRGMCRVIEQGATKTPFVAFTQGDVFSISRTDGAIYYAKNSAVFYRSLTTSADELLLDLSLYAGGDAVYDASLSTVSDIVERSAAFTASGSMYARPKATAAFVGAGAMTPPTIWRVGSATHAAPVIFAGAGAMACTKRFGKATFTATSAMAATGHLINEIHGVFPAMTAFATNRPGVYAEINGVLPAMTARGSIGGISVSFTYLAGNFPVMAANVHCLTGQTTLDTTMQLPALAAFAADHIAAELIGTFPVMSFSGLTMGATLVNPYSGVASLRVPTATGYGFGNGTLLEGGRAILTAAHVVDGIPTSRYNDIGITFYLQGVIARPIVQEIIIHPSYVTGGEDHDLAILILKTAVSPSIRRYELYDNVDEVGQTLEQVTKSPYVDPNTGWTDYSRIEWHQFSNKFESLNQDIPALDGLVVNSQLLTDFDDGTTLRDVLGGVAGITNTGVAGEGGTRPGDSGGGAFLKGKVAGVVRAGVGGIVPYDKTAVTDASYGEVNYYMRVSEYAGWILSAVDIAVPASAHVFNGAFVSWTINATGAVTSDGADIALFGMALTGYGGANGALQFGAPTIDGAGTNPPVGSADLGFVTFSLTADGRLFGTGDAALGLFTSTITGFGGGMAALSMPVFALAGEGTQPETGDATLALGAFTLSASGALQASGSAALPFAAFGLAYSAAALSAPTWTIAGTGSVPDTSALAYVMNVATTESTTYTGFGFMHIINIGGVPYGVKSDGLYRLTGATDEGRPINGTITTKETDFGTFHSKNAPTMYLNTDLAGTDPVTTVTPIVDNGATPLTYNTSFGGRKCLIARGLTGRYWRFRIDHITKLEGIEVLTDTRQRRVK
jgi:hypothetical protein